MPGSARKEQLTPQKSTPRKTRRSLVSQKETDVTPKKKKVSSKDSPVVLIEKLDDTKSPLKLVKCDDNEIEEIKDIPSFSLKRRRASIRPSLEDVTEGSTEDDDDDTREALSVSVSNYFKSVKSYTFCLDVWKIWENHRRESCQRCR